MSPSAVSWGPGEPVPPPARSTAEAKKAADPYRTLSPAESIATFDIAPGYVAEIAAAEPAVQEPVLTVWDADGAIYVAEMRSYMQDVEGTMDASGAGEPFGSKHG